MMYNKQTKIRLLTLGCSKNAVDSEVLMTQLRAGGCEVVTGEHEGDTHTVIINTCGFIENAKKESIDTILQYAEEKKKGRIKHLIVTGCLSERYKDELQKEIPEADHWFGTHDLPELLKSLKIDYRHELVGERILTTPSHYAYLKISEGCDRSCSFCAIPLMRGGHVSRPVEDILREARHLARNGVREIILIAQDLTFYGLDIYGERRLAKLLENLSEVDGIDWIRLHYAYPAGFPEEVLDIMQSSPNICKYLDIPLQHISDRILRSMRRGLNREKTLRLIGNIRDKVPGVAIRTTLIAGYPGETEEEFAELKQFVREVQFDRLGMFAYSHEEDTHAYTLADDVPEIVKKQRLGEIMNIQSNISLSFNRKKIGRILKVLIDRKDGDHYIGRTEHDSPDVDDNVIVHACNGYLRIGDFAYVRITGAREYDLIGDVL